MAIGYVGKAFVMNTVSGVNTVLPMPSTVAAGQKLYALVGSIGSTSGSLTGPSGWSKIAEATAGTALRAALYTKTAVSGDASETYTWQFPNSGRNFGYSVAYSGVDLAASNLANAEGFTEAGPWATPSLAVGADDWLLYAAVSRQNPGTSGAHNYTTNNGGDVERYDLFTDVGTNIAIAGALYDSGPLAAGSQSRSINANVSYSQTVTLAARIPAAADSGQGGTGNPWSHCGIPLR